MNQPVHDNDKIWGWIAVLVILALIGLVSVVILLIYLLNKM